MFDGSLSTATKFIVQDDNGAATESKFFLNFIETVQASKIRVTITTRHSEDFVIKQNNTQLISFTGGDSSQETNTFDFEIPGNLGTLEFDLGESANVAVGHEIFEIAISILADRHGDLSNSFEFNDSVLSTKAWNSTRYDGKQLSATTINEFNTSDISYGKTPVLRNNTKTFYVVNEIVSLNKSGSDADDQSLQFIPNFSYALIDKSITVNSEDNITLTNIGNLPLDKQKGMQREFQSNVKLGDNVTLINFDSAIKNRSNAKYPVYFNRGRLQPILRFTGNDQVQAEGRPVISTTELNLYAAAQDNVQGRFDTLNENLLNTFYTGSISNFNKDAIPTGSVINFFNQLSSHKDTTGTNFFLTVVNSIHTGSVKPPIRTIDDDAITNVSRTKNLAEISTTQIMGGYGGGAQVDLDVKFPLNRNYNPSLPQGAGQYSGSFDISILNEEKPSILINMDRETELPDGKGSKPIILVPNNLHPFVLDNLIHFSAKAGLDIGDRKVIPSLDETNRNLL